MSTERDDAVQVLRHMARAFLAAQTHPQGRTAVALAAWCELVERCSRSAGAELRSVVVPLLGNLLDHPEQLGPGELDHLGAAARRVLSAAWGQERRDRIMVRVGLQAVCRTYESDPAASAALLRQCLERDHLRQFGFEEVPTVAGEVTRLIPVAPDLVEEVYRAVLFYREPSEEATPLGGGRIMPLLSSRRQDYECARDELAKSFRAFLDEAPVQAVGALIAAVEARVLEGAVVESDEIASDAIEVGGRQARLAQDASAVWDATRDRHQAVLRMLDQFEEKLLELAETPAGAPVIDQILDLLAQENRFAAVWGRVLSCGARAPNTLGREVRSLTWSPAVLAGADTRRQAGKLLLGLFSALTSDERERIERAILTLPGQAGEEEREHAERCRDELLGCLPEADTVTHEAKHRIAELQAAGGAPAYEPPFQFADMVPVDYDEERVLARKGVPVDSEAYRRVKALDKPLRELTGRHLNSAPPREEVEAVQKPIRELRRLVGRGSRLAALEHGVPFVGHVRKRLARWWGKELHPAVEEMAWTDLSSVCACIAKAPWFSTNTPLGKLVREVLLEASYSEYPHPPEGEGKGRGAISWRHTPRSDAAEGLALGLRPASPRDHRALGAIERLAGDPVPLVRYQIAAFLGEVLAADPARAWRIFSDLCEHEQSIKVLLARVSYLSSRRMHNHCRNNGLGQHFCIP